MSMNLKAVTTCFGYQQLTVDSAKNLTVPILTPDGTSSRAVFAIIVAEGAAVRWRDDNTAPTASIGMPLAIGVPLQYDGDLNKVKFIQQAGTGIINISYYS